MLGSIPFRHELDSGNVFYHKCSQGDIVNQHHERALSWIKHQHMSSTNYKKRTLSDNDNYFKYKPSNKLTFHIILV